MTAAPSPTAARPIIIDCDPGLDDAVAPLLAMASPEELDIRGVTCVAGDVPLELIQANARRVVGLAGRTVVDWWGIGGDTPNVLVVNEIDGDSFYTLLTERVARR